MKYIFPILLLLFFLNCSLNVGTNSDSDIFGASYSLVTESGIPSINEDGILTAKVAHSGCNSGHIFELQSLITPNTTEIWLYKTTPDQDCQAHFEYEVTFQLSELILDSEVIMLKSPGSENILLNH